MIGKGEMGLIQLRFKACFTVKDHTALQAVFILLQLIVSDGH